MSDEHPRPWRLDEHGDVEDSVGDQVAFIKQGLMMFPTPSIRDIIVAAVNAHSPWISVEDRLPEDWVDVLAIVEGGVIVTAYATEMTCGSALWISKDGTGSSDTVYPTHWMPLPAPP